MRAPEPSVQDIAPSPGLSIATSARILVVDDNERNRTAVTAILEPTRLHLTFAASGEEALRLLLRHEYAAVLLDVHMPGMDGFECATLIRSRDRSRHVPILFVTAHNHDDDDVLRGYALGAVDYLFKPIVPAVLRAKLKVFVDLYERTAEVQRQTDRLRAIERLENLRHLGEQQRRWEAEAWRRQVDEQRQLNTRLAELDQRKDDFIAILAHELRNPLAPLVTNLELMRNAAQADPRLSRCREAMLRQVQQLTRLVDDLLDVSRIASGKLVLQRESVDLQTVVQQAIEACKPLIDQKQHQIALEPPAEPVVCDLDPLRLTQVMSNLLGNAVRYTDPGGHITLRWGPAERPNEVYLVVADTGVGISPHVLPRIFERFVQEHPGGNGLGLGLALVKDLVELHGGRIVARSDGPGTGSEFSIRLPQTPGSRDP